MGYATRVLLIEDDKEDQFLFAKQLVRGGLEDYELRSVPRLSEVAAMCQALRPDVIVTDLNLPDSRGLETFERVQRLAPSTPVIVLTGFDDLATGRRAIELGAQDYIVKGDFSPSALDRSLRYAITRAAMQRESVRAACFDDLTGLPNRALLRDRLASTLRRATRHRERAAVLFLDLDAFKPVNDQHGHVAGDLLLRAVAQRLRASLRASDTVSRWGGDEFVCLLEAVTDDARALQVAANLHRRLREPFTLQLGDEAVSVEIGGSFGVAVFPDHSREAEGLLLCADDAMYAAKRAGGGCVLWGSDGMQSLGRPEESGVIPRARRRSWMITPTEEPPSKSRLRG
ncbi:MAG: GGDEF domain-containing response regulator [Polyangiales bacterium]